MLKRIYTKMLMLAVPWMLLGQLNAQVYKVEVYKDTYVKNNYDGDHQFKKDLRIKNDNDLGNDRKALFSFILPESDKVIEKAVFRFYGNPASGAPDLALSLYSLNVNSWPDTVTYQTLPPVKDSIGTAFTLAADANVKSWYEIDVTKMVLTDVDDTIAFLMAETFGSGFDFWMKSSESGNIGPRIEITYGGENSDVIKDTYVKNNYDGDHQFKNDLRIKNDNDLGNDRKALFSFKLPESDKVIEKAVFRFYGNPAGGAPDLALSLYSLNVNSWPDTVTYQTLPPVKDSIGTAFTLAADANKRSWYEIDVTKMVLTDVDDTITFLMAETLGSGFDFWMKSSESGNTGPKIEITYGGQKSEVIKDTYVKNNYDGDHQFKNDLRIKNDNDLGNDRKALFSFKLPESDKVIEKAVFRFYGNPAGGAPDLALSLYSLNVNSWPDTVKYQTLPPVKDSIGTAFTLAADANKRSWYEIDVTKMVLTDADDTIAFLMAETLGSGFDFWMKSSESGNTGPKIEITYGGQKSEVIKDTYVKNNYDGDHQFKEDLRIKNDNDLGNDRKALFSFKLPESDKVIEKAVFRFYGNPAGGAPDLALSLYSLNVNSWPDTVTYQTLPPVKDSIGTAFTLAADANKRSWYEIDVTKMVLTDVDDTITFLMAETLGSGFDFWMKSSESGNTGPKIEITYGGVKGDIIKDTYVKKNHDGDHQYDKDIRIKNDNEMGNDRKALFTFVLPEDNKVIERAIFRFYGNPAGGATDLSLSLYSVDVNSWSDTIKYDALPPVKDSIGTAFTLAADANKRSWYEIDISKILLTEVDDTISFVIAETSAAGFDFWMKSTESGNYGPKVEIVYAGLKKDTSDTEPPTPPTGLTASDITTTSFTVSWEPSTDNVGILHYLILLQSNFIDTISETTRNFEGLLQGTAYTVGIIAVDSSFNQSLQSKIVVTTLVDKLVLIDSIAAAEALLVTYAACTSTAKTDLETFVAGAIVVRDNPDATKANVDNELRRLRLGSAAVREACLGLSTNNLTEDGIIMYPNPAKEALYIENAEGFNSVEIFNVTGNLVKVGVIENGSLIINTTDLQKGVYLVKLKSAAGEVARKIIK
jgi:hypothetical protein